MDLKQKTILVTGSSKNLGCEIVKEFAKCGSNVVITYLNNEKSAKSLKEYVEKKYNVKTLLVKCDIRDEESIKNMVSSTIDVFGSIDVLINNAATSHDNDFYSKTKDEFMDVLETNLVGAFLVTKYASKYMANGFVINISSTDGIDTYNEINFDYAASKAGLINLTKSLSLILNSKVICLAPNWIDTSSTLNMDKTYLIEELKRVNQKELIKKEYVAKLITDIIESDNIESGQIIRIDGE